MNELEVLDKELMIRTLTRALPGIRKGLSLSCEDLERATGIGAKRIAAFEVGRQTPKWSEYLSIVFLFWVNETSRTVIEDNDLFPTELKRAFSVNRNAHEATV